LRWIREAGSQAGVAAPLIARRKSRERIWWGAALLVALASVAALLLRQPSTPRITLSITRPLHAPFKFFGRGVLAPDGQAIVFVAFSEKAGTSLWIRDFAERDPRPVAQTEGATDAFWSPDGRNLGFFANGKLKRIAADGGPPRVICDALNGYGGAWNRDDVIVFAPQYLSPLYRVDAKGGQPALLTRLTPREEAHRWPYFLPDGEHLLFLADAPRTEDHRIKVVSLRDGSVREVMQGVTNAIYADPGFLLFVRAGSLLAQPFDAKGLTLSGEPQVVVEQIVAAHENHRYEFSAANERLVYRSASPSSQLTWVDRSGRLLETVGEPRRLAEFRLSADQRRIAFSELDADGRGDDIWLIEPARNVITRLSFDPASDIAPVWSSDGGKLAFLSMRSVLCCTVEVDDRSGLTLCQTEIEQLGAALRDHDVARFQIAMNDPGAMGLVECLRDLASVPEYVCQWQRATRVAVREGVPLDELHDQIIDSVLMTDVVERADVGVVERRDRLRLALEAVAELRVLRELGGKDFDRDAAIESGITRAIHLAHATGSDRRDDFIWAEPCTGRNCHRSSDYTFDLSWARFDRASRRRRHKIHSTRLSRVKVIAVNPSPRVFVMRRIPSPATRARFDLAPSSPG